MVISQVKLYELFRSKFGEKDAEIFVQLIEEKMEHTLAIKKDILATKDDLSALRAELLRTIYLTSMGQLLAIVASVVSLVLILKK